jgi:hypothetical protein
MIEEAGLPSAIIPWTKDKTVLLFSAERLNFSSPN